MRHGTFRVHQQHRRLGFVLDIPRADGRPVAHMNIEGVAFAHRAYAQWRAAAIAVVKQASAAHAALDARFQVGPTKTLGLGTQGAGFLSVPQVIGDRLLLHGRVQAETGFYPQHPLHDDPGDHVNAAQLLDCAMQASHLLMGPEGVDPKAPLRCRAGRAQFWKLLELDSLFEVILQSREDLPGGAQQLQYVFRRAHRDYAEIVLDLCA